MTKPFKLMNPRQKARRLAVQVLYAWELSGNAIRSVLEDVVLTTLAEEDFDAPFHQGYDEVYLAQVLEELPKIVGDLDQTISPFLSRKINEVNPIELSILRLAFFELKMRPDVPHKVVINEAIDIAKEFGAEQSHKFINGVLDKAWQTVRLV